MRVPIEYKTEDISNTKGFPERVINPWKPLVFLGGKRTGVGADSSGVRSPWVQVKKT
jgi:hypothetical protein